MDVRCNRCATEYDFDDALISERGTTVKCTNCGFQFKVFPQDSRRIEPERWVVRTRDGRELVFTSLRELQRGITEQRVEANDTLSRGQQPPRPVGSIAELEQFFLARRAREERVQRTLSGVAPPAEGGLSGPISEPTFPAPDTQRLSNEPLPLQTETPAFAYNADRSITTPLGSSFVEADSDVATPRTNEHVDTAPLPSLPHEPPEEAPKIREPVPAPYPSAAMLTPAGPPAHLSAALPSQGGIQPAVGRGSQPELSFDNARARLESYPNLRAQNSFGAPPSSGRREFSSYDELSADLPVDPGRRARSRWIAAVVLLGVLTLFALTIGRRYLPETRTSVVEQSPEVHSRVATLLAAGNRLMEEGQLEEASEQLLKATALSERDPAALSGLAHLATLQADVYWLRLRLLDPKLDELVQATSRELSRRVSKARSAVDAAFAVAPDNIVVQRARVDLLRLSGDGDTAREWIKPIASQPSDPENSYVLAALDLAEATPSWPTIIDRLRTAAHAERAPGRAHAALIYALTRADRVTEAQAVLSKLEATPDAIPLLDELKGFVRRHEPGAARGAARAPAAPAADPRRLERAETPPAEPARGGDFRKLLELAGQALRQGELGRAERLYQQVLEQHPRNTEALAGLGDIARRRHDPATAARMYDRVLTENPSYLPALLASADQKWDAGDRKGALVLYRRVLDQAGTSTEYGQHAAVRIGQAERHIAEEASGAPKAGVSPDEALSNDNAEPSEQH